MLPDSLQKLIDAFSKLPGVGKKTAQRFSYFLLRAPRSLAKELCENLRSLDGVNLCQQCFLLSDQPLCAICRNTRRDVTAICVVEHVFDAEAIEACHEFHGVYHVLHGRISPLDNVMPEDLKIAELLKRVNTAIESGKPVEVILATNPSSEGEVTALYLQKKLKDLPMKVTRIATGVPVGSDLEYADEVTLGRALKGRQKYE